LENKAKLWLQELMLMLLAVVMEEELLRLLLVEVGEVDLALKAHIISL